MNFFGAPRIPPRPVRLPRATRFDGILSDDDIARVALQFQTEKGEGLAFINPQEAALLRRAGGSGRPVPGTQGLGPMGGPIRSYDKDPGTTVANLIATGHGTDQKLDTNYYDFESGGSFFSSGQKFPTGTEGNEYWNKGKFYLNDTFKWVTPERWEYLVNKYYPNTISKYAPGHEPKPIQGDYKDGKWWDGEKWGDAENYKKKFNIYPKEFQGHGGPEMEPAHGQLKPGDSSQMWDANTKK